MPSAVGLRDIADGDLEFLYRVYASTREEELAVTGWSEEEKASFLHMQFNAQHTHYQQHFNKARFSIITLNGEDVGRLYVDKRTDEIRIVDIALLPEFRGQGIGGELLKQLLAEASEQHGLVRIHVESNNPAMTLYLRLGFKKIEEQGVYYLMEHRAA